MVLINVFGESRTNKACSFGVFNSLQEADLAGTTL